MKTNPNTIINIGISYLTVQASISKNISLLCHCQSLQQYYMYVISAIIQKLAVHY